MKALETVPYEELVKAYNKVKPVLEKAGEYFGDTPLYDRNKEERAEEIQH